MLMHKLQPFPWEIDTGNWIILVDDLMLYLLKSQMHKNLFLKIMQSTTLFDLEENLTEKAFCWNVQIYINLHDRRGQCQHHIDKEVLPFPASCIQIPGSVRNSCYTMVGAMQPPAKGSHCDLYWVGLSSTNHTEHLIKKKKVITLRYFLKFNF